MTLSESAARLVAPRGGGDPPDLATNYALAFDLLKVAGWVAAHTLPGEKADEQFVILQRAVAHLRGQKREPVRHLDELLRNDPWAAAIASHVRHTLLLEQDRDGEPAVTEVIAWMRNRPGCSWEASIIDIGTAVNSLRAARAAPPEETSADDV